MTCNHCKKPIFKPISAVNRAAREGRPLYCNRECAGLGRRLKKPPTAEERKEAKRLYDANRRLVLADRIKAEKRAYYQANRDPDRERAYRKTRMPYHVEYCRRPEYRAYKATYDRQYLARKQFGEFADAALILRDIEAEISSRMTRTEIYQVNGTLNKTQVRKRAL